ncbi:MAG: SusC/RagA family TonB-linked outer membrane protein [Muribaculaceae bacterium]|nr:SusC/RagA family TonB-linked outer membrane protein [Muribaculaceae bacterium]
MKKISKARILFMTFFLSVLIPIDVMAQITVSGTVFEEDGTTPMTGATVIQKGTQNGVSTDIDGKFSLKTTGKKPVIVINYIGYTPKEITVTDENPLTIVMNSSAVNLNEVVVTALGITREQKSLGYSVSKIDNEQLTSTVSGNWLNAINGKVAGLNMSSSNSGPSGSLRVTLRGEQSLNYGANEALFVVDGVPISSGATATASGGSYSNSDAPIDYGNDAADINPDDVESVSVLKGPAATALYGSRAANGAIIITTKSGRKTKGIGVTVNSSVTWEKAGFFPDFQKEYGSGNDMGAKPYCFWKVNANQAYDGIATSGRYYSRFAWGEKFNPDVLRYQYASRDWNTDTYTPLPWVYQEDWYTGLFETGTTYRNTVTVDGNNGKGTSGRLSITDTHNDWILPNTGYQNQTVAVSVNSKLNKYINLNAKVNYYHKESDNFPVPGYQANNPLYALVWGRNTSSIKNYADEYFGGRFTYENWITKDNLVFPNVNAYNPYRTLYEETNSMRKNRVFGNVGLNIKFPVEGLTLALRGGMDMTDEFRTQQKPYYSVGYQEGFYREQSIRRTEVNMDFLLRYVNNRWLDKRLGFNVAFGGNRMDYNYYNQKITLKKLDIEGVYNVNNAPPTDIPVHTQTRQRKAVNSLYGFVNISWDDTYYLDITGRNDWSSTLARGNWSFFYPSVSASILLDRMMKITDKTTWIDLLKLRLSWANVGNDTTPYSLENAYAVTDYTGGYRLDDALMNRLIRPENVESWEAGIEARFLQNRIGLDLAVYNSSTTDQIVSATTDIMAGATSMKINAGEIRNRGIEISLHLQPVQLRDFSWTIDMNWARNWNKLVRMNEGWDNSQPLQTDMGTTVSSTVYVYSYVGQSMHQIYGKGYKRAPAGAYYIDENTGERINCEGAILVNNTDGYPRLDDSPTRNFGNVNPDWTAGLSTRFRYKGISLSAAFTAQVGGHCYSITHMSLAYQGKLKNTLEGRYGGLVVDGVNEITNKDGSVSYTKNKTITESARTYYYSWKYTRDNVEENTFSTDFLKLKELRLDYELPASICSRTKILRSASIGAYATNVFCITKFPQYDPETGSLNGTDIHRGIEAMAFPMTRTYGVNLKLAF